MIDFLKQMIEQIPIFIKLNQAIDILQEIPYFKTIALAGSIIAAINFIPRLPKIIRKFKRWDY